MDTQDVALARRGVHAKDGVVLVGYEAQARTREIVIGQGHLGQLS